MGSFLVTGGAGFIGSNFVELLVQAGHRVIVLDALTYAGHQENLAAITGSGSYQLIHGNIGDRQLVSQILHTYQIEAVFNLAAESHVDQSIHNPAAFIETNIVGVFHLLQCCQQYMATLDLQAQGTFRVIQVSTDEVYGSLGTTGKFKETSSYSPNSPYSASKAAADHLARAWFHTYKLPTIITNCSNNYGPRQFPEKLIPYMIYRALREQSLPVYGCGKNVRDWIHVSDHCQGIWRAYIKGIPGETYCFGGNSERQNIEVVRAICRHLTNLKPRQGGHRYEELITFVEDRQGHDWRYAIDDTKAQKELGFSRQYADFEEGLEATIQWYLGHQAWMESVLRKTADEGR